MKTFKKILLGLLLLVSTVGNAQWTGIGNNTLINQGVLLPTGPWVSDSGIVSGLFDVGDQSAPTVFYINTDLYLISGTQTGLWFGWKWSGITWVSDSGIVSGLTDVGGASAPTVFYINTDLYLISGEFDGVFNGWKWSGSTWVSDSGIVSGLTDIGLRSKPTTFYINTDLYLISGEINGDWFGWKWSGSTWVSDSGIISGLFDVGGRSAPTVFYIDTDLYLISGDSTGGLDGWDGWKWSGSTWVSDSGIVSGLNDIDSDSVPTTFYINTDLYLISGSTDGLWDGWKF